MSQSVKVPGFPYNTCVLLCFIHSLIFSMSFTLIRVMVDLELIMEWRGKNTCLILFKSYNGGCLTCWSVFVNTQAEIFPQEGMDLKLIITSRDEIVYPYVVAMDADTMWKRSGLTETIKQLQRKSVRWIRDISDLLFWRYNENQHAVHLCNNAV